MSQKIIITEDGKTRITEDGNQRVTEDSTPVGAQVMTTLTHLTGDRYLSYPTKKIKIK
jgi:hypothetical protein